jgi:hypothetical protein
MEPVVLIQIKAWLTLAVGALFLLQSTQVVTVMGGKLHDAGVVMAQLFGSLGYGLAAVYAASAMMFLYLYFL